MGNKRPLKKTATAIRQLKSSGTKVVMATAYDATFARLFDQAGIDMLLVGDSLGMVIQGDQDTLGVTLEDMIYHGRAVARGAESAHVTVDMPFMSYQVSAQQALESAGRLVKEGEAESVKLEGGQSVAPSVERIVAAGIPVVGHVGLTPQSVHAMGGFKVQGRTDEDAQRIVDDAVALEQAGCFSIVLEGIPMDVAAQITDTLSIPTIGIGAGPHCDGQVLVGYDLLGMNAGFRPKFLKTYADLATTIIEAAKDYAAEVRDGVFPTEEHSFHRERRTVPLPTAKSKTGYGAD